MPWKCYMTEPSELACRYLRRYASNSKCHGEMSYHNSHVLIDPELPAEFYKEGGFGKEDFEGDPRWPASCDCGYEFTEADAFQVNVRRLYRGAPDGQLYMLRDLPIGGIWEAPWLEGGKFKGPEGKIWCLMLPGGAEWIVYGPSSDGRPWKVTGKVPNITVVPSIAVANRYHGHIRNGVITEDVEGRKFPGIKRTA